MNFTLKFSKYTFDTLKQLQSTTNITPNILARIAVGLSLRQDHELSGEENKLPSSNVEINRNTITGEYDYIFKALIAQHCNREITDEEYFPTLFNAHLERGIRILANEYKHSGNYEKLVRYLLS
jgi:DNA sulfur modification protein DndE